MDIAFAAKCDYPAAISGAVLRCKLDGNKPQQVASVGQGGQKGVHQESAGHVVEGAGRDGGR
eukprot:1160693-Prorocentrum_lima.AAC.1